MNFTYADGATPLDPDSLNGLIPQHIDTQKQLNEWEAQNIKDAKTWAFYKRRQKQILTLTFIRVLHRHMFGKTWQWAGEWRKTQTIIGCDPRFIVQHLHHLMEDVAYQLERKVYPIEEIAFRLHHRLVGIHPFPNGNGRHARLMTDIFLYDQNHPVFTWGNVNLVSAGDVRQGYLAALRAADHYDYDLLKEFLCPQRTAPTEDPSLDFKDVT